MLTQFYLSCCSLNTDLCEIRTYGNVLVVGKKKTLLLKRSPLLIHILPTINVTFASLNYSGPDSFDHASLLKAQIDDIVLRGKWKYNDNINYFDREMLETKSFVSQTEGQLKRWSQGQVSESAVKFIS